MFNWMKRHPLATLSAGAGLGLLVGVGMMIGTLVTLSSQAQPKFVLPEMPLHAVATDTGSSMSMATGPVDADMEGVFFLDFLTGELQCAVLNGRTATLGGIFKGNVVKDLGVDKSKKPNYLMVTGMASFTGRTGNAQPARCIVYVLDQNTGNFAGYSLQWDRTAAGSGRLQAGALITLVKDNARTAAIRE